MKHYSDRIPACGVFCGGCPIYTREKNPCPGAGVNIRRCEKCRTFHLCCKKRGITHCYECTTFPCSKFKSFAGRWKKYGQDFVENQKLLKSIGEEKFRERYNAQADETQKRTDDIKATALRFNDRISRRDINGLVELMTDDHVFIDMENNRIEGISDNRKRAWESFFNLFPGYQNIFEKVAVHNSTVIMQGYSVCPDRRLDKVRAIWLAEVRDDKISSWHIYPDTEENRKFLNI
jgi:ketosteroid isomerase-like protein